jgi:LmbE family N-acetylglucosaminyl deacetylase
VPRARITGVATVVAFHAHPDDEVLLTGGTLALLAAGGHRVVVVVACDGVMGEATGAGGRVRLDELEASASVLGAARVVHLGYADSGHGPVLYPDPGDRVRFARADVDEAAAKLVTLLRHECADVLISYDRQGGYGHRDHRQVHAVGRRAVEMVETVRLLEATLPRRPIVALFHVTRALRLTVRYDAAAIRRSFSPRSEISYRVNVRRFAPQKQRALAAHTSQRAGTGRGARALRMLVRLPTPVFGLLLGHEWFGEPGAARPDTLAPDILRPAGHTSPQVEPPLISVSGDDAVLSKNPRKSRSPVVVPGTTTAPP